MLKEIEDGPLHVTPQILCFAILFQFNAFTCCFIRCTLSFQGAYGTCVEREAGVTTVFFSGLNWLFALRTYLYDSISHMFSVIFSPVHSQQVENATWWFHPKYVGMALVLPWKSMCWIVESRVSATQCSPRPTRILDDFVSWLLGSQFKTCFFGMGHADTSEEIFCLDDWQIVSSPAASIQWDISRCTNDSSLDCPLVCTVVCTGCSDFLFPIMCIGGIIRGVCCQMLGCGERYPCILGGFLSST